MRRPDLVPDCGNCDALCCVATSFDASEDFAIAKPAGEACPNLAADHRCSIHDELAARGFGGCAIYDCYGAGQRMTRALRDSDTLHMMRIHGVGHHFLALRVVHELLWLLTEAATLCPHDGLSAELDQEIARLDAIDPLRADDEDLDVRSRASHALLRRVGEALLARRGARALVSRPGARAQVGGTSRGIALPLARCPRS